MNVPQEVADRRQWMLWTLEYGTKVPYQCNGSRAKSNDPKTWATLDEVTELIEQHTGIAFVFSEDDPFCGVDLDDCINELGEWEPWAEEIRERFRGVAYGEISPSGTGAKFTTKATKPAGSRCTNQNGVECYDRKRFWTWTGRCIGDGFDQIGDGQTAINWIIEKHLAAPERATGKKREIPAGGGSFALLARAEAYVDTVAPGVKGDLRNGVFRLSGHLHSLLGDDGERLSDTDVLNCLRRWNMRGIEQLREDELREAAVNGRKNGTPPADKPPKQPEFQADTVGVDLSGILGKIIDETPEDVPFSPGDFPRDAIPTTGIIGELIAYNLATSMFPQPELALAGGLALMSTITGRKVENELGTRTNVYVLGLGDSGSGKEHARKLNKKLLYAVGAGELIGPERIGSSAGLTVAVKERLSCLFQIDEIGHLLATMKNAAKSPHLYNIATVLMQMYSSSDSVWIGDAYADSKKTPIIEQPHPVLYGTCTPEGFWVNLSADSVANGLLGRMLVFESPGRVARRRPDKIDFPESLTEAIRWWWEFTPSGIDKSKSIPVVMKHKKDAMARFEKHVDDICQQQNDEAPDKAALWSRTGEKTAKLAMLFACSRQTCTDTMSIGLDDVERAIKVSNWLTRRMLKQAHEYVASNQIEDNKKRVLRAIGKGISMNSLSRRTQWLRSKDRIEILAELQDRGDIVIEDEQTSGRPKRTIRRTDIR